MRENGRPDPVEVWARVRARLSVPARREPPDTSADDLPLDPLEDWPATQAVLRGKKS